MAIAILAQSVADLTPAATSHTVSFAVPAGTDMLLAVLTMRGATAGAATVTLLSQNAVAMSAGFNNFTSGAQDINSLIAYRRNPDVGTFDVLLNCASVNGGAMWLLALSGVIGAGSPVGITAAQRVSSAAAVSVGLGLTPSFAGSMLVAVMASGGNLGTVTGFTGTSFSDAGTGRYSPNGDMPYTARYRLNVPATAVTATTNFSDASANSGGLLAEILAEASATTDVSGTADAVVTITGSTGAAAGAEILDASFRQIDTWTEMFTLQPDAAGVDRRIISAGVLATPTLTLDQLAANKNYSWSYRLSDGNVRIDSATNTQTLTAHHLALIHNGAAGQAALLNGIPTGGIVEGASLSGNLVIATGGERIGAHGAISPGPYTGLIGRYLLYAGALTAEQVRLMALSETDPDSIWGIGSEDDAQVVNQSLVACPLHSDLDGQPSVTLVPVILDPSGGTLTITGVTQPANGTLAILGLTLIYQPTRGWQGNDSASYTASDGIKSSTGRLTFRQTRPALKLTNDTTTVAAGGSGTFDPRTNDVGAGTMTIVTCSTPSKGTVTIETDGRLKYTNLTGGTADSFTYTVQDTYSQQSATVSVTITAGSFLTAGDVSKSTTKDKFIDVDVVAAASASADLKPIVVKSGSITTPTMGGTAALQSDGKIRYTPETGESGYTDTFDFTLKPSAFATPTDVGTVSVQVLTATIGLPKSLPAAVDVVANWRTVGFEQTGSKSTHNSGNLRTDLVAAMGVASGGDVIVLADGTYSGTKIIATKNGTTSTDGSSHIMMRAQTHGKAIINLQLDVDGEYWWFTGLKLQWDVGYAGKDHNTKGNSILCRRKGLWVTNCQCTSATFLSMIYDKVNPIHISNVRICYNDLLCVAPTTAQHMSVIALSEWDADNILLPTDVDIAWNRVTFGPTAAQTGADGDSWCKRCFLLIQHGKQGSQMGRDFRIHYNHVQVYSSHMLYCKKNLSMQYNYLKCFPVPPKSGVGLGGAHDFTYRHGWNAANPAYDTGGLFIGNLFDCAKNVDLRVNGSGCVVNGNSSIGAGAATISLEAGVFPDIPVHDAAEFAQCVDNLGFNVVVGSIDGGKHVGAETVTGHNGWPTGIQIYKGDRGWNPSIVRDAGDVTGARIPTANYTDPALSDYGTGNAAKVTTITVAGLSGAGCDAM